MNRQVGVAGKLYRFAAPTERLARRHVKKIRADLNCQRPSFLVLRRYGSLTKEQAERIYQMPIRETLHIRKEDLKPLIATLRAAGEDGKDLCDSIMRTSGTTSEAWSNLNRARIYVSYKGTGAHPDRYGKTVDPPKDKKTADYEGYDHGTLGEFDPDEFDAGVKVPESQEDSEKPWDFTHNAIFASLARRDFKALRELGKPGHRLAKSVGGPRSYKEKLVEVLASKKGLRLYVEDFSRVDHVSGGKPSIASVPKAFGLTRREGRAVQAALKNVKWVSAKVEARRQREACDCTPGCGQEEIPDPIVEVHPFAPNGGVVGF